MDDFQTKPLTDFLQAKAALHLADPPSGGKNDDGADGAGMEATADTAVGAAETEEGTEMKAAAEKDDETAKTETAETATENKVRVVLKVLRSVEQQVQNAIRLLEDGNAGDAAAALASVAAKPRHELPPIAQPIDGRIVEGVFDGQGMVGSDGKSYSVPPNYASKSKLVEGDMLKLTITPKGSFIYKQVGPIERSRLIGTLGYDDTIGQYYAASDDRRWNVLRASVTYFKGEPGDEVVLLVPKSAPSKWAAVENIIKKNPLE